MEYSTNLPFTETMCSENIELFISEVEMAVSALNGRYFGGRTVKAEKYSQDLYQAKDFSG